ncbi:beta-N-acetylhexosaminidase [Paenibacillus cymbidii]|uniref:beta-N-acetylhexosaminidase n=1 Tax=Paenibacillus cymbidii TaxID=1639034 RepID=UPI001081CBA5|nr:beta-N-acetylhexosaminidase [Paenibacillus cymbidii]
MRLDFKGDTADLNDGIRILAKKLPFEVAEGGFPVYVKRHDAEPLTVEKNASSATISYERKIHFFRALGLLLEHMDEVEWKTEETPQFATNGIMFDVSQGNAVINVANVKKVLTYMSLMGLNMMMLYCEDSYEVEEEPYFGYMRGKYSEDELRECDRFADQLGIEMIPCIQTLAHLIDVLKWDRYSKLKDDDDTLLVGYEPTYEFIERMIKSATAPFRSKRIHIGMDEAWKLGQGKYLLQNGYRNKAEIMNEHLHRVIQIVDKLGLQPMIWSDMYFRAASPKGAYFDLSIQIPQEAIDGAPKQMQLVFWDYYHHDEHFYREFIRKHQAFGQNPIFAGGIWGWSGFAIDYDKTFLATNAALRACKSEGIDEVFATIWGDGGVESNLYGHLLGFQLFAEHGYSRELDMEKLKKRFAFCTGGDMDDFLEFTWLDRPPGLEPETRYRPANPSKYLLWQDPLAGLFDKNIEGLGMKQHYRELADRLRAREAANAEWKFLFRFMGNIASVLADKAELGIELYEAYHAGDRERLRSFMDSVLPALIEGIGELRINHRQLWMEINKPLGWEVLDIRYGGLLARMDTTIRRLDDYLNGCIDKIDELEQERLYYSGKPGLVVCNMYSRMPSASRLSFSWGF